MNAKQININTHRECWPWALRVINYYSWESTGKVLKKLEWIVFMTSWHLKREEERNWLKLDKLVQDYKAWVPFLSVCFSPITTFFSDNFIHVYSAVSSSPNLLILVSLPAPLSYLCHYVLSCDPLNLTRVVYVTLGFKLFIRAWRVHLGAHKWRWLQPPSPRI